MEDDRGASHHQEQRKKHLIIGSVVIRFNRTITLSDCHVAHLSCLFPSLLNI